MQIINLVRLPQILLSLTSGANGHISRRSCHQPLALRRLCCRHTDQRWNFRTAMETTEGFQREDGLDFETTDTTGLNLSELYCYHGFDCRCHVLCDTG